MVLDSSSFLSQVEKNELIELYSTLLRKLVFTREVLDPKFHKNRDFYSKIGYDFPDSTRIDSILVEELYLSGELAQACWLVANKY